MTWLEKPMKDATISDMPWRGECSLWTRDFWMRLLNRRKPHRALCGSGNAGNWSVLVPAGKEINRDSVSKSDWKRNSPNWIRFRNISEMWCMDFFLAKRNYLKCAGTHYLRGW